MMKLIIIIGIISVINSAEYDSNKYLKYLLQKNKLDGALHELDRLLYIHKDDYYKNACYKIIEGYIYQIKSNHNMAINIYDELLKNERQLENNIIDTLKYNYALSLFEIGKFEHSLNILDNLTLDIAHDLLYKNLLLLCEKSVYSNYELSEDELYNIKKLQSELKKPIIGSLLSSVFPGLGQIYSKHYFDGVQSLILNLIGFSFTSIALNQKSNYNILPIITLSGTSILYFSNILTAKKTVYYYNQQKKRQYIINNGLLSNPILISIPNE